MTFFILFLFLNIFYNYQILIQINHNHYKLILIFFYHTLVFHNFFALFETVMIIFGITYESLDNIFKNKILIILPLFFQI